MNLNLAFGQNVPGLQARQQQHPLSQQPSQQPVALNSEESKILFEACEAEKNVVQEEDSLSDDPVSNTRTNDVDGEKFSGSFKENVKS